MARSLSERLRALQASVEPGEPSAKREALSQVDTAESSLAVISHQEFQQEGFSEMAPGVWHRRLSYDVLTRHGSARFADLAASDLHGLHKLAKLRGTGTQLTIERLRFYDTETTGLGTGAGTFPFLHAVGQFEEDEFIVHQYFLADYSAEVDLLSALLTRHFAEEPVVVSFNGKSFDWPLFSNRLTMHRLQAPAVSHIDLLYPSRRLWKQTMTRVSLASVESTVLGLLRLDDLPGREAPLRYFEYVSDGGLHRLVPVFEHNATDVCSLVTLASRLADIVSGQSRLEAASEWSALGRIYDEWNESDLAFHCFHQAVSCPDASWREHWLHSLHCKRQGNLELAAATWHTMALRYPWSVPPCVELAKAYEHRLLDLPGALKWATEARTRTLRNTPRIIAERPYDKRIVEALDHRLERIKRKLGRT